MRRSCRPVELCAADAAGGVQGIHLLPRVRVGALVLPEVLVNAPLMHISQDLPFLVIISTFVLPAARRQRGHRCISV